jgi:hypothetical protein
MQGVLLQLPVAPRVDTRPGRCGAGDWEVGSLETLRKWSLLLLSSGPS